MNANEKEKRKNLVELSYNGYWFCWACNKITSRVQRGTQFVCIKCGNKLTTQHNWYKV